MSVPLGLRALNLTARITRPVYQGAIVPLRAKAPVSVAPKIAQAPGIKNIIGFIKNLPGFSQFAKIVGTKPNVAGKASTFGTRSAEGLEQLGKGGIDLVL